MGTMDLELVFKDLANQLEFQIKKTTIKSYPI